jgi:hypothetical protein
MNTRSSLSPTIEKTQNSISRPVLKNFPWAQYFLSLTTHNTLKFNTVQKTKCKKCLENRAALPLSLQMFKLRKDIQRLSFSHKKVYDLSILCSQCFSFKNLSPSSVNAIGSFLKILDTIYNRFSKKNHIFKRSTFDYTYFVVSKKEEFNNELYLQALELLKKLDSLHQILYSYKESFNKIWKVISPKILARLFSSIEDLIYTYDQVSYLLKSK